MDTGVVYKVQTSRRRFNIVTVSLVTEFIREHFIVPTLNIGIILLYKREAPTVM